MTQFANADSNDDNNNSALSCYEYFPPQSTKRLYASSRKKLYLPLVDDDDQFPFTKSSSPSITSSLHAPNHELVPDIQSTKRFKSSSSSSSSIITNQYLYLPDDLVTQILEFLPIKSIVRFRLLSKSWSALFKTQTFITNHRLNQNRTNSGTMLLLRRRYVPPHSDQDVLSFHDLDSPQLEVRDPIPIRIRLRNLVGFETQQFSIQGPVNGIICILNAWRFILCNPALHEFKLLPSIPWDASPIGFSRYPCESGFGVTSSGEFKVIFSYRFKDMMNHTLRPNSLVAHLYSSRTNSWRRLDDAPLWPHPPTGHTNAVVLNGAWHWPGRNFSSNRKTIVSCDVTSEVFGQLELPDCLAGFNKGSSSPVVLKDCLGVLHHRKHPRDSEPIEIWVMEDYGVKDSWNKLFVISPQPFVYTFLPWKNGTMFLLQIPGLSDLERRYWSGEYDSNFNDQLTSIDLRTGEMKEFQVFGAERTCRGLIYEESLVSLY